ncbi:hypothetical protein BU16DRAFT_618837 [Lophium mytilinum]|uniref:Uncharacterized protein n=1 Tax=Lophium mytilinum TaxID=390894 RepID=A0A6A6QRS2_9PEZI|nr:hypothetical protein BU16DRAFT_618837 [Lophium mytilinum]
MPLTLDPRDRQALIIVGAAIITTALLLAYSSVKPPSIPQPTAPTVPRKKYNRAKTRKDNRTLPVPQHASSSQAVGRSVAVANQTKLNTTAPGTGKKFMQPSHTPPGSPPNPPSPTKERSPTHLSQTAAIPTSAETTPRSTPSSGPSSPSDGATIAAPQTTVVEASGLLARQTFVSTGSYVIAQELIRRLAEIAAEREALRAEEGYDEGYEGEKEGGTAPGVLYVWRRGWRRGGEGSGRGD